MTHYFGIDESFQNSNSNSLVTFVLCHSTDRTDVAYFRHLDKKRYVDKKVFDSDFIYFQQHIRRLTEPLYRAFVFKLIIAGIKKFSSEDQNYVYIDDYRPYHNRCGLINPGEYFFIINRTILPAYIKLGSDTKHPIINRADHLANLINSYEAKKPDSKMKHLKSQCPNLDERLIQCRVK